MQEIRVSVILPISQPRALNESVQLLPSMYRAAPGVLAGLEEADWRGLTHGVYFNITFRDSHCDNIYAPKSWTDAVVAGVDVLFGPSCEFSLAAVARQIKFYNVTLLTAGGLAFNFNEKKDSIEDEFYLLTRTGHSFIDVAKAVYDFMEEMDWHRLLLIYRKNDRSEWSGETTCAQVMSAIVEEGKKKVVTVAEIKLDMTDKKYNSTATMLRDRMPELNYSISALCASRESVRDLMLGVEETGMLDTGQYVFINIDLLTEELSQYRPWHRENSSEEENQRALRAFQSVYTVSALLNRSQDWDSFRQTTSQISRSVFGRREASTEANAFTANFHDAALLFAQALNETLDPGQNGSRSGLNGEALSRRMRNRTFQGVSGEVKMNSNGDREADYVITATDYELAASTIVRRWRAGQKMAMVRDILWYKSETTPLDFPLCGFDGICDENGEARVWSVVSVVTTSLLVILVVIAYFIYKHYKEEAEIASMHWKISPDDILSTNQARGSKISLHRPSLTTSFHSIDSLGCEEDKKQAYVKTVYYKSNIVAIKRINVKISSIPRSLMLELKRMKDLQHEHIARFLGACLEPGYSFLLIEYCPRGSLQDILEEKEMDLDWDFRFSLIFDIVKGMLFISGSDLKIHGNLKSSNCLVDSRFVVKLTDFGLESLRAEQEDEELGQQKDHAYWKRRLWTAPELLCPEYSYSSGTQKGDVYAFGIILHEIAVRRGTWGVDIQYRDPRDIVGAVIHENIRPPLEDVEGDAEVYSLMERCWAQDPLERPDFSTIRNEVRKLNKTSSSSNILDNLLSRMERYADNLEGLVEERTQDYLEEKRKCEELLYELLPRSVAKDLIEKRRVPAESFPAVTIYFSDIVGFTSLSATSRPLEVVHFLNDLYTCFDSILLKYDVYKVETIGDAYMVVSGLPETNGNNHVREIARMSLEILERVKTFRIHHRPGELLKLRIGIHTGACCAGVVGIKMPRYCLFGDTVNTASRMESNGLPQKIHISETTKEMLDLFGTFQTELRGEVDMKGKGKLNTFWLLSELKTNASQQQPGEEEKFNTNAAPTERRRSVPMQRQAAILMEGEGVEPSPGDEPMSASATATGQGLLCNGGDVDHVDQAGVSSAGGHFMPLLSDQTKLLSAFAESPRRIRRSVNFSCDT